MNRLLLIFFISFFSVASTFAKVTLGFPGEDAALVGIIIKDINTGEIVAENDSRKVLLPASVMKSITAATAISLLDQNFRFETEIFLTGEISDGVCSGNLVIKSCGDPTIDSELFNSDKGICKEIVESIVSRGVTIIQGDIIVEESLSQQGCIPEWEIADVAWEYGAGLFGFNYKDNVFRLWPATKRTRPHVPDLKVTTIRNSSEDLIRGVFSNNLYALSPNPDNTKWSVGTTMPSPATVFAYALNKELKANGISVKGNKTTVSHPQTNVCLHKSPALDQILREMMVHSHNLYAEGMLRALAPTSSRDAAIKKELGLWNSRGLNTRYMKICDGSGLARADRISASFVSDVLLWMVTNGYEKRYTDLFPRVGREGTVKIFLKDTRLEGRLALKTGSMNAVQCYAGYKFDEKGVPTHVVVVLINGFFCDRPTLRKHIEKFLLENL